MRVYSAAVTVGVALAVAVVAASAASGGEDSMPAPFVRQMEATSPAMTGTDVVILQNLVKRAVATLPLTGAYDAATVDAVKAFQTAQGLGSDGIVGPETASAVLHVLSEDGYKDDGRTAAEQGYLYKLHVPVHRNRSIETTATLYAANGTALFAFTVRAHGHNYRGDPAVWPNFNESMGLNSFTSDGDTPTGLSQFDLNSPEGEPKFYGPYPVNRVVKGLRGNAAFLVPSIRDGILLHTGEWSQYSDWKPPMPMPNSAGCIHAYPASIERVWKELVAHGVTVNPNTGGKTPYPYKPQGIISVELVD